MPRELAILPLFLAFFSMLGSVVAIVGTNQSWMGAAIFAWVTIALVLIAGFIAAFDIKARG